ncbi:hypothetical protein JB92DRAFT_3125806 [Gautieria morchelliformis]|nr:hypothetical protein JB92DRAFT_3125806 [Gautieria morchelliformis]
MPSQATPTFSTTFAPPLPTTPLDRSKYPPPTQVAPIDTGLKELDGVMIPDIPVTQDHAQCASNPQAAADPTRCWWTCGGCTRDIDVVSCPTEMDWGVSFDDGPSPYTPLVTQTGDQFDTNDWKIPGGEATGASSYAQFQTILANALMLNTGFIVLEHDLYQQSVDLATGYTIPSALQHNPPFNLKSINQFLGKQPQDVHQETAANKTLMTLTSNWTGNYLHGLSSALSAANSSSGGGGSGSGSAGAGGIAGEWQWQWGERERGQSGESDVFSEGGRCADNALLLLVRQSGAGRVEFELRAGVAALGELAVLSTLLAF